MSNMSEMSQEKNFFSCVTFVTASKCKITIKLILREIQNMRDTRDGCDGQNKLYFLNQNIPSITRS